MSFNSIDDILKNCVENKTSFWKTIINDDIHDRDVTYEQSYDKMKILFNAMLNAGKSYDENLHSSSGLVGGDGGLMSKYTKESEPIAGEFTGKVITQALQMGEANACMKRIVAAPTAGSCGVLPAVLLPLYNENKISFEQAIESLYVSAGIGQVIAERAYIAGAAGGCQAEIGTASAMAAGALVHLKGGTNEQISNAVAMALKNLLGLVCDPVGGLVEVPCVKRNVIGAVNAMASADMALAGIKSRVPTDQVIDTMKEIGDSMSIDLKETGRGGLAATPFAEEIAAHIN